ncbi:hypothetical protein FRC02_006376 [Tulasnella sp. 418]|nr:hypothetical protein FRC02_006376 [Tulasnella sp. 418]
MANSTVPAPAQGWYYAVHVGAQTGVFTDWSECALSVVGHSGAVFCKFRKYSDAIQFVGGSSSLSTVANTLAMTTTTPTSPPPPPTSPSVADALALPFRGLNIGGSGPMDVHAVWVTNLATFDGPLKPCLSLLFFRFYHTHYLQSQDPLPPRSILVIHLRLCI